MQHSKNNKQKYTHTNYITIKPKTLVFVIFDHLCTKNAKVSLTGTHLKIKEQT